ncbi:hypothetical protein BEL05_12845 [Shewanella colwelliana]|uniref:Uncharacterized protein n=1 Tax=Shewanella colwelliana TaxID=23 RepID=A0A1E5IX28_SHECO|nr:hypothetical protein BEL05_12845 [Shewanella colwelliana]
MIWPQSVAIFILKTSKMVVEVYRGSCWHSISVLYLTDIIVILLLPLIKAIEAHEPFIWRYCDKAFALALSIGWPLIVFKFVDVQHTFSFCHMFARMCHLCVYQFEK